MKLTENDKVIFTIGDSDNRFVGYSLDSTWNGFDNVAVTEEVHKKLLAWCKDHETEVDAESHTPDEQGLYHWCNGWAIEIDEEKVSLSKASVGDVVSFKDEWINKGEKNNAMMIIQTPYQDAEGRWKCRIAPIVWEGGTIRPSSLIIEDMIDQILPVLKKVEATL